LIRNGSGRLVSGAGAAQPIKPMTAARSHKDRLAMGRIFFTLQATLTGGAWAL